MERISTVAKVPRNQNYCPECYRRIFKGEPVRATVNPRAEEIVAAVAHAFGTTPEMLRGPRRGGRATAPLAYARFAAVALMIELMVNLSMPAIARIMGYADHTSVMHARKVAAVFAQPDNHHGAEWRERYAKARAAVLP